MDPYDPYALEDHVGNDGYIELVRHAYSGIQSTVVEFEHSINRSRPKKTDDLAVRIHIDYWIEGPYWQNYARISYAVPFRLRLLKAEQVPGLLAHDRFLRKIRQAFTKQTGLKLRFASDAVAVEHERSRTHVQSI